MVGVRSSNSHCVDMGIAPEGRKIVSKFLPESGLGSAKFGQKARKPDRFTAFWRLIAVHLIKLFAPRIRAAIQESSTKKTGHMAGQIVINPDAARSRC